MSHSLKQFPFNLRIIRLLSEIGQQTQLMIPGIVNSLCQMVFDCETLNHKNKQDDMGTPDFNVALKLSKLDNQAVKDTVIKHTCQ